jgi:hypothetical protein
MMSDSAAAGGFDVLLPMVFPVSRGPCESDDRTAEPQGFTSFEIVGQFADSVISAMPGLEIVRDAISSSP